MAIAYKRTVAPTSEPVGVSEAKDHLEIYHSDRDTYIDSLISVAREMAEDYTARSFFTQTWVAQLDQFPNDSIELIYGQVQSITTLKYYDVDNVQQTWDSANYRLDTVSKIAKVEPIDSWPSVYDRQDAIEITYVAGESDTDNIDYSIKQGILMLVAHLFEN